MDDAELLRIFKQINKDGQQALDLSGKGIREIPRQIGQLLDLEILNLSNNELSSMPPQIGVLLKLEALYLEKNHLEFLHHGVGDLIELKNLYVDNNRLKMIGPEIGKLVKLLWLRLSNNQITDLPSSIGNLILLNRLFLDNNHLDEIPSEIGNLSRLGTLNLSHNNLTKLPPEIGNLTQLQVLDISHNQLTSIPSEIGNLEHLRELNLNGNRLKAIPKELGKLSKLEKLDLNTNMLSSIPAEISRLTKLVELDLSQNKLKELPSDISQLANLKRINLRNNFLRQLPETFYRLTELSMLDLRENELALLPEVLEQINSPQFLLQTYFEHQRPLREAKMLIVGQGGVGKTSLVKNLLYNENQAESDPTAGVEIHQWEIELLLSEDQTTLNSNSARLNIWDFGGQGIYQTTHQFFFTERSLYLLVINARQGEHEGRLYYWLSLINNLSRQAPILIIVNQIDLFPLELDKRGLMAKYKNLMGIINTSCKTGEGIDYLKESISKIVSALPNIHNRIPESWFTLKTSLEQISHDYIPYDDYVKLCQTAGITEVFSQQNLIRVLHELGVILNFADDRFKQLEETQVLNPEWVTEGVYQILTAESLRENHGLLIDSMLNTILDREKYPPRKHSFIMDMMNKFELCQIVPGASNEYLVPDLLPQEQPELNWNTNSTLAFEYHYSVLPSSVLVRFMVRMVSQLDLARTWRNGTIIMQEDNEALIRADPEVNQIHIWIAGAETSRRSLLSSIRTQFREIHSSFPAPIATEHIPLPGYPGRTVSYKSLLNYEKRQHQIYYDGDLDVAFKVQLLLDGIETPDLREQRRLRQILIDHFNLEELKLVCVDLGVDYENLGGQSKSAKALELVEYFKRQNELFKLDKYLQKERPSAE